MRSSSSLVPSSIVLYGSNPVGPSPRLRRTMQLRVRSARLNREVSGLIPMAVIDRRLAGSVGRADQSAHSTQRSRQSSALKGTPNSKDLFPGGATSSNRVSDRRAARVPEFGHRVRVGLV